MKTQRNPIVRKPIWLPVAAAVALLNAPTAHAAYPDLILSNNPVAYYRLEELPGATTAFDATSNHFDATYVYNAASDSPQLGLPGIVTNSIAFNGGANFGYVLIPFHPELSPVVADGQHGAPFSVECWAQPNSRPVDYASVLGMFGPFGTGTYVDASGWNFAQTPGASGVWLFNMKHGPFAQATGVPITLLQWYHLAATFDGTNASFYVNGVSQGSFGASGYLADNGANGQIGVTQNAGIPPYAPFSGGVDEVAFYTNVLRAAQILAHYQVGTNSFRAVPTPPGFLQQPASRTNFSGTTATFTAVANGTTPLSFQWKRGGAPIPGATNSTYSFTCAYPADDGATFSATVTNLVGSSNSAVATLTVLTNLNLLYPPFSVTRNVGSKAAFRVAANGALPITYQWYKIATSVTNAIAGATNDTVWLNNVQLADDQSQYYARVANPFTFSKSDPATLTVQARPVTVPITGYGRVVLADDPVAYWRLDEPNASGIATDAVGSFDGTYQANAGTLTYQAPDGIPHETNAAITVTGGSVVTIPYALELNPVTGPWSFEIWIKPGSLDPNNFRTPFSSMWNSDFGGHLFGWNIYQHVAGVWTLNMYNGGGGGSFVSDFVHNPINTNTWYYMVISDDLTTIRYYVNNVLVVTLSRNGFGFIPNGINGDASVAGAPTVLGQRSDNAFGPFDGSIDDAAVYNYALSPQQIQLHYLNTTRLTLTKSGSNVVLTWPVGTLQQSDNVTGTYTDATSATSPWTVTPGEIKKFYRIRVQ